MSDFRGLYDIRGFQPGDENLIISNFLKGVYYGDSWFSQIPKAIFMKHYRAVIETLLAKGSIYIACLKDDPNTILGFSILSEDHLHIHYVYVKKRFRNHGIARSLVPKYPISVSHLTALGKILLAKFPDTIFNPFNI